MTYFASFLGTIDKDNTEKTELIFRCNICERTLNIEKLVRLVLDTDADAGTNILKALVIDGKAAEIIKSLPKFCDEKMTIPEGNPDEQRAVSNRETKNAVKYFIRLCRAAVQGYGHAASEPHDDFVVREGENGSKDQSHAESRK